MATLLIATPFVHSSALSSRVMIGEVRGLQGQRTSRVSSCRVQASVSATGEGHVAEAKAGRQDDVVTVLQSLSSPLLNLSPADLIDAFFEEEVLHEVEAQHIADVAAQTFQTQVEPVAEPSTEVQQVVRRRTEKVIFTEEKARRLRKENRATQTFHDKWYHSAIASRLATPE